MKNLEQNIPDSHLSPEKLGIRVTHGRTILRAVYPDLYFHNLDLGNLRGGIWLTGDGIIVHEGLKRDLSMIIGPNGSATDKAVMWLGNFPKAYIIKNGDVRYLNGQESFLISDSQKPVKRDTLTLNSGKLLDIINHPEMPEGSKLYFLRIKIPISDIENYLVMQLPDSGWATLSPFIDPKRLISGYKNAGFGGLRMFLGINNTKTGVPFDRIKVE